MSPATTSSNTESLRKNVKLLGRLLGEIISEAEGEAFYETVEAIRRLSKSARAKNDFEDLQRMFFQIGLSESPFQGRYDRENPATGKS